MATSIFGILDNDNADDNDTDLERVILGDKEKGVILFTDKCEIVDIHFCDAPDINDYIICNDDGLEDSTDCAACQFGYDKKQMFLFPCYSTDKEEIGVLPVSLSRRPNSLLVKVLAALKSKTPQVLFIKRKGQKYTVTSNELTESMDGGESVIEPFMEQYESGLIDLKSIYQKIDNDELKLVTEIAKQLEYKGII